MSQVVRFQRQNRIFDTDRVTTMRVTMCHRRRRTSCGCQGRRPPREGRHSGESRQGIESPIC
eukprot:5117521-Pyramimonas_sp.AAC.1